MAVRAAVLAAVAPAGPTPTRAPRGSAGPEATHEAALDGDHARLEAVLGRIEESREVQALSASLQELSRVLTEHLAHEVELAPALVRGNRPGGAG